MRAMHIHILGICGTFMGSLAVIAKQLGYRVSGSDQHVYPPMSTQLQQQGIELMVGYDPAHLADQPDMVVIGNTCSRGNPSVEYVLARGLPYCSGPQWLAEHVLQDRWVLAVAGTHGKTTTTSMLTWILHHAGLKPGYLIGGVPINFQCSADLGESPFFVIEADEYDSAFFDKRSKFVHYRPRTAILGNLEFDHADIFADLPAIQTQFSHLLKIIPGNGLVLAPAADQNLAAVFAKGLWCEKQEFAVIATDDSIPPLPWVAIMDDQQGAHFRIINESRQASVSWSLTGRHNVLNGLAAVAAACHAGVPMAIACAALCEFRGVKRRLELIAHCRDIKVYDDFAHHPTAIQTTLEGVRARLRENSDSGRILAVIEARSNTMKMGFHQATLAPALAAADQVFWYKNQATRLDLDAIASECLPVFSYFTSVDDILQAVLCSARPGDHIIIMSNGGFEGFHQRLCEALQLGQVTVV
jgi:UDP-N-acetylmuramate: L-alanyl-gamma-D-glutamyl-meso-diaminopimelate ligase